MEELEQKQNQPSTGDDLLSDAQTEDTNESADNLEQDANDSGNSNEVNYDDDAMFSTQGSSAINTAVKAVTGGLLGSAHRPENLKEISKKINYKRGI